MNQESIIQVTMDSFFFFGWSSMTLTTGPRPLRPWQYLCFHGLLQLLRVLVDGLQRRLLGSDGLQRCSG